MNDKVNELNRLNFEDYIWVIFIVLSILNIVCNKYNKEYVISNDKEYEDIAKKISIIVLIVLVFIYLYFFVRNYNMYNNKMGNVKDYDLVKLIWSLLFLIGTFCLLYFQVNSNDNFIDDIEL